MFNITLSFLYCIVFLLISFACTPPPSPHHYYYYWIHYSTICSRLYYYVLYLCNKLSNLSALYCSIEYFICSICANKNYFLLCMSSYLIIVLFVVGKFHCQVPVLITVALLSWLRVSTIWCMVDIGGPCC